MFTNISYRYGTRQIFQKKCRNFLKDVGLQSDPELSLFPKAPFFLMIWIVAIRGSWSDKDCSQCSKIFRYWYSNSKYVYFRVLFIFCGMIFCDKKFWWFKFMILEIDDRHLKGPNFFLNIYIYRIFVITSQNNVPERWKGLGGHYFSCWTEK